MNAVLERPTATGLAHDWRDLVLLFDSLFRDRWRTVLVKGDDEPIYLPRTAERPHSQVVFAHGYFASALHEIAHWCIAGARRRKLVDYGYWYRPDGRDADQQRDFERVEAEPQALEWIFSRAAGSAFVFSADNLSGAAVDPLPFQRAVAAAARRRLTHGLPGRARRFTAALCDFYDRPWPRPRDFVDPELP